MEKEIIHTWTVNSVERREGVIRSFKNGVLREGVIRSLKNVFFFKVVNIIYVKYFIQAMSFLFIVHIILIKSTH